MKHNWKSNIYLCELAVYGCTLFVLLPCYLVYLMYLLCFDGNTRIMGVLLTGFMSMGAFTIMAAPAEAIRAFAHRRLYEGDKEIETILFGLLPGKAIETA